MGFENIKKFISVQYLENFLLYNIELDTLLKTPKEVDDSYLFSGQRSRIKLMVLDLHTEILSA